MKANVKDLATYSGCFYSKNTACGVTAHLTPSAPSFVVWEHEPAHVVREDFATSSDVRPGQRCWSMEPRKLTQLQTEAGWSKCRIFSQVDPMQIEQFQVLAQKMNYVSRGIVCGYPLMTGVEPKNMEATEPYCLFHSENLIHGRIAGSW